MLFNSHVYILAFLPTVVAAYFLLNRLGRVSAAMVWLFSASLVFYGYWNPVYLPLILSSVVVNFAIGASFGRAGSRAPAAKRGLLVVGLVFNLGLLGYFKYADFFIANANALLGSDLPYLRLVLPLAISFFTFQQIAYLVDSYRGEAREYSFLSYSVFVTFFPQLIAGPIVHHREMMPQFQSLENKRVSGRNLAIGVFVFSIGLFKKVMIADTFAEWATAGFDGEGELTFLAAWAASLSFTFQLYFDFSGYTDMALGSAYLFNIRLPLNFNSPYQALDIRDFWRRWHMTLSRWLRDYLYIPLGGNRRGEGRAYVNLFATFLLGGLWHGAAWTFVAWGALHGAASMVHRAWRLRGGSLGRLPAWALTFLFVNLAWVPFRATTFEGALRVLRGMFGLNGFLLPEFLYSEALASAGVRFGETLGAIGGSRTTVFALIGFAGVAFLARNSMELAEEFEPDLRHGVFAAGLLLVAILHLSRFTEFLYFNF